MSGVSGENKNIARKVASVFGGKVEVDRYYDGDRKSYVDLISSVDRPHEGVNSYGTIGLSDHKLVQDGQEFPVRLELVGASNEECAEFPNMLTTAAFCVINDQHFFSPGGILSDVVSMYDDSLFMKHFLFVSPFLWDGLSVMDLGLKKVAWLMVVPISESEKRYAERNGAEALEDLFESRQINIFDLGRESVV